MKTNSARTCTGRRNTQRIGPVGLAGLSLRDWTCSVCQTRYDRDVNAAKNNLRIGLSRMEEAFFRSGRPSRSGLFRGPERTCPSCRRNLCPLGRRGRQGLRTCYPTTFLASIMLKASWPFETPMELHRWPS
ncbi:zinc ribbon domain-containing protein [Cupriavidus numazuensis]